MSSSTPAPAAASSSSPQTQKKTLVQPSIQQSMANAVLLKSSQALNAHATLMSADANKLADSVRDLHRVIDTLKKNETQLLKEKNDLDRQLTELKKSKSKAYAQHQELIPESVFDGELMKETAELKNFLGRHFSGRSCPAGLLDAQQKFILQSQILALKTRQISFKPSLPFNIVGDHYDSTRTDAEFKQGVLQSLVVPVYVFVAESHMVHRDDNSYKISDCVEDINSGRYFQRFFCKCGNRYKKDQWRYRMCYDVDGPAIFACKSYECADPQCSVTVNATAKKNEQNNEANGAEVEQDQFDGDEDVAGTNLFRRFMNDLMKNYGFIADLCPVIMTKKRCFTHNLRRECVVWQESKSNINEYAGILEKRYADNHHRKLDLLYRFFLSQRRISTVLEEAQSRSSSTIAPQSGFYPRPGHWAALLKSLFFDAENREKWLVPPFRSPGVNYLRSTVLVPHLQHCRAFVERTMEHVKNDGIISMDTTYASAATFRETRYADGKVERRDNIRSTATILNGSKQVLSTVFLPTDTITSMGPAITEVLRRPKLNTNNNNNKQVIYTDNCCHQRAQLEELCQELGIDVTICLDYWHWIHRFFANGTLPLSNNKYAFLNRIIIKDITDCIPHDVLEVKGNNKSKYKKFSIPDAETLKNALEAKREEWKSHALLKEIVESDKVERRWNLQMRHVEKGCLSDPLPQDQMYISAPRLKYPNQQVFHCRRGTNANENIHRQINATISSNATMSPLLAGLLSGRKFYHHNYFQACQFLGCKWIEHGDPEILFDIANDYNTLFSSITSDVDQNPYMTDFHRIAFQQKWFHKPCCDFFEHYHRKILGSTTSSTGNGENVTPIPGWLDRDSYQQILENQLHPVMTQRKHSSKDSSLQKVKLNLRVVEEIGYSGSKQTTLIPLGDLNKNSGGNRNNNNSTDRNRDFLVGQSWIDQLEEVALTENILTQAKIIFKSPDQPLNDDGESEFVPTPISTEKLFETCCEILFDIDDTLVLPRRPKVFVQNLAAKDNFNVGAVTVVDDDNPVEVVDEDVLDAIGWQEEIQKQYQELEKARNTTSNHLAFTLQRCADVLACVIVVIRCFEQDDATKPSEDAPFFIPRDVRLSQNRPAPHSLMIFALRTVSDTHFQLQHVCSFSSIPFDKFHKNMSQKKLLEKQKAVRRGREREKPSNDDEGAPDEGAPPPPAPGMERTVIKLPGQEGKSRRKVDSAEQQQQQKRVKSDSSVRVTQNQKTTNNNNNNNKPQQHFSAKHVPPAAAEGSVFNKYSLRTMTPHTARTLNQFKPQLTALTLSGVKNNKQVGREATMIIGAANGTFVGDRASLQKSLVSAAKIAEEARNTKKVREEMQQNKNKNPK